MLLTNKPHQLFTPEQATAKAAEMQEGDPDWTYTAIHSPTGVGWSYIEIKDEAGEFVGNF